MPSDLVLADPKYPHETIEFGMGQSIPIAEPYVIVVLRSTESIGSNRIAMKDIPALIEWLQQQQKNHEIPPH